MTTEPIALVALGLSALNSVVTLMSFRRADRWKDTEAAGALLKRVTEVEHRCTGLEVEARSGATKADVAALAAKIEGMGRELEAVDRGVERIEQFLIGQSK